MSSYLTPIGSLLIALGIFFGYVYPTYTHDVMAVRAEIGTYDNALAAAANYLSKQDEISTERGSITEENLDLLNAFLPNTVDNIRLILDLNSLASKAGVTLSDIDVRLRDTAPANSSSAKSSGRIALQKGQLTDSTDVNVHFDGTYERLLSFLSAVEHSLRPLDVVGLSVGDADGTMYPVDVTLRVYWLP